MRWESLFEDLEGQLEREFSAEQRDLGAQEERVRLSQLSMIKRLESQNLWSASHRSDPLRLALTNGEQISLRLDTTGADWISGSIDDGSSDCVRGLIPVNAIDSVSWRPVAIEASLALAEVRPSNLRRLELRFALRDLCRRRYRVRVALNGGSSTGESASGSYVGGAPLGGTIDRVGNDHLDLAIHDSSTARRDSSVHEIRMVALRSIVIVRF